MPLNADQYPAWLNEWMYKIKILLWGAADLRGFSTPPDKSGNNFNYAVSMAVPMNPQVMKSIQSGPNQSYADEYLKVNNYIRELSASLASEIISRGFQAQALPPSERTDTINIKGDFPHKTAATRAGLGWVGKNCQLITRKFGPWVRLATVFTDMELPAGPGVERSFCGRCTVCIEACPAKALKGAAWNPGMPREEILDAQACDKWKKENYFQYHNGHNCGICAAVCPIGLKALKK